MYLTGIFHPLAAVWADKDMEMQNRCHYQSPQREPADTLTQRCPSNTNDMSPFGHNLCRSYSMLHFNMVRSSVSTTTYDLHYPMNRKVGLYDDDEVVSGHALTIFIREE